MKRPLFFVGLHKAHFATGFTRCMLSVNVLLNRRSDFAVNDWLLDSGAFSRVSTGAGHLPVEVYAGQIQRWSSCGHLLAAVVQDYMCEPFVLEKTGMTIADHQRLTIERYDALTSIPLPTYIMPVLQGYEPEDYAQHLTAYGNDRLPIGAWVGVGSICKRNATPDVVIKVLQAIKRERPDLRLHGFGLKVTALKRHWVNELLYSCDSLAWSYQARWKGGNANDPREAQRYAAKVASLPVQLEMGLEALR